MASDRLPWLPDAIYFDANTLVNVPHYLKDPKLQAVATFARKYNRDLLIPHVAWLECVRSLYERCEKRLERLTDDASYIGSVLAREELQVEKLPRNTLFDEIEKAHEKRVTDAGFKIIPTPHLEVQDLLAEAICKKEPFQSGGKGFRDAVILETVARHAVSAYGDPVILVISSDKAVQKSAKRLEEKGVHAAICSPDEAPDVLEAALNTTQKEIERLDEEAALKFLDGQADMIFDFVRRAEVRQISLEHRLREAYEIQQPTIQDINAVDPQRIASASPGFPLFGRDLPADRYPFRFTVEVRFHLSVRMISLASILAGPKIKLDQLTQVTEPQPFEGLYGDPIDLPFDTPVYVDAAVSQDGAADRDYKDLELIDAWL